MEQRRFSGKSHWYHETQSSASRSPALPLVPEAATVNNPFLLDLSLPDELLCDIDDIVTPARKFYALLFPQRVTLNRLHTFSAYDRLSTALTAAQVFGVQRLCNHYAARLAPLPGPDSSRESNHRLAQITQYARQLAASPSVIDARARQQLEDVGLTLFDLIVINQIIGFIAFQARVMASLQALLALPVRIVPGLDTQQEADAARFTSQATPWQPGFDGVDIRSASTPQLASLAHWQILPELRLLAPQLAHEHLLLNTLGEIVMQLTNVGAESLHTRLVALYTARINGSYHCFAEQQLRWRGDMALLHAVRGGGRELIRLAQAKENAVVQAVHLLTCAPDRFSALQFTQLTETGFNVPQALRLLFDCALHGWLNRLKIGLGQSV
ncbi:hypothetical protein [Vagococcus sp. WN89Y]|uniref:carboxymuconolactone decarboxylase family protein n=1 Tax=Vagococcus sp. WN89Y TaxID=3457258 RepID=UPI003FCE9507